MMSPAIVPFEKKIEQNKFNNKRKLSVVFDRAMSNVYENNNFGRKYSDNVFLTIYNSTDLDEIRLVKHDDTTILKMDAPPPLLSSGTFNTLLRKNTESFEVLWLDERSKETLLQDQYSSKHILSLIFNTKIIILKNFLRQDISSQYCI